VEKYLKAALVLHNLDFPKTHSIENLLRSLPPRVRPNISEDEQDLLSEYATVTPYPGDYDPISLTEARKAVTPARRVRKRIRKLFPKKTAGMKRKK
jgi:HEPN domain-containing protein